MVVMASPLLCLFCFLLLSSSADAQTSNNNGNLTAGSTLSAAVNSSSWLSPSGDFAFGFYQLENTQNSFLLSIWYANIPRKTMVWYGNEGKPVAKGSTVEITSDRGLVLNDSNGVQIWTTESNLGRVSYGFMNDTGNFELLSSDSEVLWESFKDPKDTLLPTQVLELGGLLSSRRSETKFTTGRFQLRLLKDGNLVLNTINLPTNYANEAYYISGTYNESNSTNSGRQLIFGETGHLYILRGNGQMFNLTAVTDSSEYYYRATLNFDGVFTQYRHPKKFDANERWDSIWSEPENICMNNIAVAGSGICGYNSVCRLGVDQRPTCECPTGYSLDDPNDIYGSCKTNFSLSCGGYETYNASFYYLVDLMNIDWPESDYELLKPFSEAQCKEACLSDCRCAVSIFGGGDTCWKKKIPLSNGKFDGSVRRVAYVKIRKDDSPIGTPDFRNPDTKKDDNQDALILAGSVLLGGSVLFNFILLGAIGFGFFFIYNRKHKQAGSSDAEVNLRRFTYQELSDATHEFEEELGRGGFGIVYKGKIEMGSSTNFVAVKKLNKVIEDGEKEFQTEMNVIGQTHHKNLVRLFGFCDEGSNRLLVYEFLSNGTLASLLFGDSRPSWNRRIQTAFGIARGLLYLHEECSTQIIHCDIKPQNILLDDYFNVRISDFGLAKLLMLDQSHTQTGIRGTKGYVAPEWFRNMPITVKVDVYSFGVLLLEIICCRKCVDMEIPSFGEKTILTDWAYDCHREGSLHVLVEDDYEAMNDIAKVEKFVMVALWCIQEDPYLRPTMRKVTQMLEGVVEIEVPPCPTPFITSVTMKN